MKQTQTMARHIIIIGASSGLGRQVAIDFARRGWKVGIAARRKERLEEIADLFPDRITVQQIDVNSPEAPDLLLSLIAKCGGMDTLLYAAGVGYQDPQLNEQIIDTTLMTNAVGFARLTTAAYKYLRDRHKGGRIAAITSIAGTKGMGIAAAYSATKRFEQTYLEALCQLSHTEHAGVGITDIRPGFIRTDLLAADRRYPMEMTVEKVAPKIVKAIIRGRRVATIDWRWRIVVGLWRLIPRPLWQRMRLSV